MLQTDFFKNFSSCYDNLSNKTRIYEIKKLPLLKVVETNEELDKVAFDEYSDETKWWIIAIYNDIINPFFNNENRLIKVPDIEFIDKLRYRGLND